MEKEYKWDLTKFCKSNEDCKQKVDEIITEAHKLMALLGSLNKPKKLKEYLIKENDLGNRLSACYVYAQAGLDVDNANGDLQALTSYIMQKDIEFAQIIAPFDVEIKNLGVDYLKSLKNDPDFADWVIYLDKIILEHEHILSEQEEKLIAEIAKQANGFKRINESCYFSDMKYDDIVDSNGNKYSVKTGNINKYRQSPDRQLRKNVAQSVSNAYANYGDLMSQTFISYLNSLVTINKLRKYPSILDARLSKYFLTQEVYNNVQNFSKKYREQIETNYYKIKKELLNLDSFYFYDTLAPLEMENKTYTIEEGIDLIKKAMAILGEDYVALIDKAITEKWVDVYPRDKKRSGGYTWGAYGYGQIVLMNWNNNLDSVFTLVHELGHAIHHTFLNNSQELQNSDVPIFMAEIASTFNEIILANYLIQNSQNEDEKFGAINYYLHNIIKTVFSQCVLSEFEDFCYKSIENNEPLNREILSSKWFEITAVPTQSVIDYTGSNKLGWQNIWHFYNQSYYVWQYALSFMISTNFASKVLASEKNAIRNYFEFLCGGNQEKPAQFLNRLGVNIYSEKFYQDSYNSFLKVSNEFEKLAKNYLKNKK